MSFMFSVLGSVTFWLLYFVVSFFMGSILLKNLAPHTFKYIILGQKDAWEEPIVIFCQMIGCFILWPILLISIIIIYSLKFIIGKILWPSFCQAVKKAVSIIPDIEIKKAE